MVQDKSAENQVEWSARDTEEVFEKDIMVVQALLPDLVPWDELLEETIWDPTGANRAEECNSQKLFHNTQKKNHRTIVRASLHSVGSGRGTGSE